MIRHLTRLNGIMVPLLRAAKWNSLADLGNNTIAALASTNFEREKIGVWIVKGRVRIFPSIDPRIWWIGPSPARLSPMRRDPDLNRKAAYGHPTSITFKGNM